MPRIRELQLRVDASTVRAAILRAPKLKVKECDLVCESRSSLRLLAGRSHRDDYALFELHRLRSALTSIIVSGIKDVSRAIITLKEEGEKTAEEKASGKPCHRLLVEGAGLQAVMGVLGVRGNEARSGHVMEVERTLGIEAARITIVNEIVYTMQQHGMDIDWRHVALLADVMTSRGEVLGITRFGVPKMKQSVLMLASFEKTTDHLFEAAVHSRTDAVAGVSECIILGIPIQLGTGLFKMLHRTPKVKLPKAAPLLFPSREKHLSW
jgi:DNA-directed RNA polymerase III subunit RPC1